jgi:succinate dehydrogenase/fumarate reductase flavoprotein subunit
VACFTQGHRAGINAASYAKSQPKPVVNEQQVAMLKQSAYAPLDRTEGIAPDDLQARLAVISYRYLDIMKHEERLKKGIEEIEKLKIEMGTVRAGDYHQLVKCHSAKSTVDLWEIMAKTALERTESRADHYREDYPLMDNDNWLKWLIVRQVGDGIEIAAEDIPFEEKGWKHRPEPGKIDNWRK